MTEFMQFFSHAIEQWPLSQWLLVGGIFVWSGFVRAGLGFGGAALALPFLLMVLPDPQFWLPIIAVHLLVFTVFNLSSRWRDVEWRYMMRSLKIMIVPKIIGVLGLINLPADVLAALVYSITLAYAAMYVFNYTIKSEKKWVDNTLLVLGGYTSGVSLIGAPLISAVYMRHIDKNKLRSTLFALWILLVVIKLSTFIALGVPLNWGFIFLLLPFVAVGHGLGSLAHEHLISANGNQFKFYLGLGLSAVCLLGLYKLIS